MAEGARGEGLDGLRFILTTALIAFMCVMAIQRGFWPRGTNSTKWYDRAINATGGILLLLFWVFLLIAYFFGPQPAPK